LGTDLDFNKIQNMLLGKSDLSKGKYKNHWEQLYRLDDLANNNTKKILYQRRILVFKTRTQQKPKAE
jgi:hypothetical protein